jgi:hypothetical protein
MFPLVNHIKYWGLTYEDAQIYLQLPIGIVIRLMEGSYCFAITYQPASNYTTYTILSLFWYCSFIMPNMGFQSCYVFEFYIELSIKLN